MESHLICFAAEQARVSSQVVEMEELWKAAREEADILRRGREA